MLITARTISRFGHIGRRTLVSTTYDKKSLNEGYVFVPGEAGSHATKPEERPLVLVLGWWVLAS
jgi:hypothetical protein